MAVEDLVGAEYSAGFISEVEADTIPAGLDESVVRFISGKKSEPEWLTEWRLEAFRLWQQMTPPAWAHVRFPEIDFQGISYYSAPKKPGSGPQSLDDVDPELLRTYEKLGIPLHEQEMLAGVERKTPVAVDAVFDSVSITTTFKEKLAEAGVIFCSISEAVQTHPELVKKYLGSVVPQRDNFYATLNSAVFSDGSFVYVPPGVRCPMELSTYFRINAQNTGQFERTLIIADAEGAYVSYLEGCTAPMRDENQLHAAVVELVALEDAQIKYSTVQNWYPGDKDGRGGIYNFVTKRGACLGDRSKISWTQVETGSAITWKYPSVILRGADSVGEFYSVALTNNSSAGGHRHQDDSSGPQHAQHDHRQRHQRRKEPVELPRPGAYLANRPRCPQLHPVRFPPDRQPLWRPYLPLHREPQPWQHHRARSHHLQGQRRPAVSLPAAGNRSGKSREHDRQRLLQGRLPRAAHGIRGGGRQAARGEPGRSGRMSLLEVEATCT